MVHVTGFFWLCCPISCLWSDLWVDLVCVAGFTVKQWSRYCAHKANVDRCTSLPLPAPLPLATFTQKFPELPVLQDYRGVLPSSYWAKWTKRSYRSLLPVVSWVCPNKLLSLACTLGYSDRECRLGRVVRRLQEGTDIGCRGTGRLPTSQPNSPSAAEYGARLADSLQGWIMDGICFGPMLPEEMPWLDYTVSPILVALKPNGKARICVNLSAPHSKATDVPGKASSVNSGIDPEEFHASMSSTKSFCVSLMREGCPAEMCKLDWNQAYKHQAVHAADHKLQVFEFGGRLFGELMCTFGSRSSVGIYDDLAKVVKDLVTIEAGMDSRMVSQVLDDVVACGMEGDGSVDSFYRAYRRVGLELGVSLAEESDRDKAFATTHWGKVLGIMYDLRRWVWWLSEDKLVPLVLLLGRLRDAVEVDNGFMKSLNGKLNHYMWLVPGGLWQRGFLLGLQNSCLDLDVSVVATDLVRQQASWWIDNLRAAAVGSCIPDWRLMGCLTRVHVFPDAAGGVEGRLNNGAGGFCPPSDWFYLPWSRVVRENRANSLGVTFAHKLCCLEGFGCLLGLVTIPDLARNGEVVIHCDNAGFVGVFRKMHCHCPYSYSVAKALFDVGVGLGCKVSVVKTGRCSGPEAEAADALSKGDWERAWPLMPRKNVDPGRIPVSLLQWIRDPIPDLGLGRRVLSDMARYTSVLHLD